MSRSSSFDSQSHPCTRWLEWHGEKGLLRYYDRDTKTTVDVPLPFSFLLLDTEGLYRDIRDAVVRQGGKYHASLYVAFRDEAGELRIGNLRLKGAALQSWSEVKKEIGRAHV